MYNFGALDPCTVPSPYVMVPPGSITKLATVKVLPAVSSIDLPFGQ